MEWTKENIATRRYGAWGWNPKGTEHDPTRCAEEVWPRDGERNGQCLRKPGHGPDGLYCKQHAKMKEGK